ncbi:MAG TPA: Zn-ribbon domain-containing OB-fold protein [Alphaproteobacteria bacterium]|nr:Zn-ribbon domain-containing OB-fold protein [Alphaproteobacteria bacterium]
MTDAPYAKPLPRITPDNAPFYEGLKGGELRLPRCADCRRYHFPPGPVCPYCFSEVVDWTATPGRGTVSSWVVVHKAWFPAFEAEIPYNVVQVELEEGPRLTANVVDLAPGDLAVGMTVEAVYDAVTPERTLLRFRRSG